MYFDCVSVLGFLFCVTELAAIWILGSSIIHHAGSFESYAQLRRRYNLERTAVHWLGIPGAGTRHLYQLVQSASTRGQPDVIVVHLGANDLGKRSTLDIIGDLWAIQSYIREGFPASLLLFSELLYRGNYRHSANLAAMDRARKRINTVLHTRIAPGRVIPHRNLDGTEGLLRADRVHLSDIGNTIYINNIFRFMQHSAPRGWR